MQSVSNFRPLLRLFSDIKSMNHDRMTHDIRVIIVAGRAVGEWMSHTNRTHAQTRAASTISGTL
eukprot:6214707-Pleurochrysis_carterae.AAC.4